MAHKNENYTYCGGKKIKLDKLTDQFIARLLPEELQKQGISDTQKMSSASSRILCPASELEKSMSTLRLLAPSHHAYQISDTKEEFLITDRLFITFSNAISRKNLDAFTAKYALIKREQFSDREFLFQLTDHTGMNPIKLVIDLTENSNNVALAEHDLNYRATISQLVPTDPAYLSQWHLHTHRDHPEVDPRSSANCEQAWEILGHYGHQDIVIGVTDDGCKLTHPDFNSDAKFAGWGYFSGTRLINDRDIDSNPENMYEVGSNHGTSCAGVIAGEADAVLTVGAAPDCRLFPVKWESEGPSLFISASKLRTAIDYMNDKVDIISNSWGITPTSFWPTTVTNRIAQLAKTGGRRSKGILFLWAAGNENCLINHTTDLNVPYTDGWTQNAGGSWAWAGVQTATRFTNSLVDIPGVMHVAALASDAKRSHYSNYGPGIMICAPSSNSHAYFRKTLPGLGVTTTTGQSGDITDSFGGTSSATPLVAGVAALALSANANLSALEVASLLKQTASKDLNFDGYERTPPASFDLDTGWDISPIAPFNQATFSDIDSADGTWSPWFGHGKVDAQAVVARAQQLLPVGGGGEGIKHYESKPVLPIPDNSTAGIRDVIDVAESGVLNQIKVAIDITHSWIGDLQIRLISPAGKSIMLHDRSGSSSDNIKQIYDGGTLPALQTLRQHEIQGGWTLEVNDTASADVGVLNAWSLDFETMQAPLHIVDADSIRIPDNKIEGISRILDVPDGRTINTVEVSVDITHPWIGDLTITLTPPDGTPIPLHHRSGSSADNIQRTWHSQDMLALQNLIGQDTGGQWRLTVADRASRDIGKLNRWSITIN